MIEYKLWQTRFNPLVSEIDVPELAQFTKYGWRVVGTSIYDYKEGGGLREWTTTWYIVYTLERFVEE